MATVRLLLCIAVTALLSSATAQPFGSYNIDLVGRIAPDTNNPKSGNRYSGCWGWYQASKNKEYAISGGRNGTWFVDVTNPATPSVSAFVPGRSKNCTWREVKTYSHYCYIVSDVCRPNGFQIVDMQYLPDSVRVVYNDSTLFKLGHTAWIDNDKLYVGSTNFNPGGFSPMTVWSLANPELPNLIRKLEQDDHNVAEIHDMYVRNDTVYASAGWQGLRIYKLQGDSLEQIASYSNYHAGAYNHSSFLTQNGKYLVFCDEVPAELPIRVVDVSNLQNIQPVQEWHPFPHTTPHNPYVLGNDWAVVSSYQDGLFIYDLRALPDVILSGWFDTHPQGGYSVNDYGDNAYQGNWGAYPFLPSGIIIAQDMQNGIFLLDPAAAFVNPLGVPELDPESVQVFPNPASGSISIRSAGQNMSSITLTDLLGRTVLEKEAHGSTTSLDLSSIQAGTYLMKVNRPRGSFTKKIIVAR